MGARGVGGGGRRDEFRADCYNKRRKAMGIAKTSNSPPFYGTSRECQLSDIKLLIDCALNLRPIRVGVRGPPRRVTARVGGIIGFVIIVGSRGRFFLMRRDRTVPICRLSFRIPLAERTSTVSTKAYSTRRYITLCYNQLNKYSL